MSDLIELIKELGFPIAMCFMMLYFMNTSLKELTKAVNNNTTALQVVLAKLTIAHDIGHTLDYIEEGGIANGKADC